MCALRSVTLPSKTSATAGFLVITTQGWAPCKVLFHFLLIADEGGGQRKVQTGAASAYRYNHSLYLWRGKSQLVREKGVGLGNTGPRAGRCGEG